MGEYLFADSREPAELLALIEEAIGPGRFHRVTVETADYVIFDHCGHGIGIERKSIADFLCSLGDGRVRRQFSALRDTYHPILLLEGRHGIDSQGYMQYTDRLEGRLRSSGWRHGAVQMALFALQSNGVRIIWTASYQGTVDVLRVLLQRSTEKCLAHQWTWEMIEEAQRDGRGVPSDTSVLWLEPGAGSGGAVLHPLHHREVGARRASAAPRDRPVGERPTGATIGRAKVRAKRKRTA
jgi:ERCC4-type nuclease